MKMTHYANIAGYMTGGDVGTIDAVTHRLSERSPAEEALEVLTWRGVPNTQLLRDELARAESGLAPLYCVSNAELVNSFRARHNLYPVRRQPHEEFEQMQHDRAEYQRYGVSLRPFRDGLACWHEQRAFYDSPEWDTRRTLMKAIAGYRCEKCKTCSGTLDVQHHDPIYSAGSRLFHRLFDVGRLRVLCRTCHEAFHARNVQHFYGFDSVNEEWTKKEERAYYRRLHWLHDELKECRFCFPERNLLTA